MTDQPQFGKLFRKYRLRSEFETIRELADAMAQEGYVYDESLFSHWQKGDRIPKDRRLLLDIIKIFLKRKGIQSLDEANEFFQSSGHGYMTKEEITHLAEIRLMSQLYYRGVAERLWGSEKTIFAEINAKTIWIVAPDFYWCVTSSLWPQIVLDNIVKGTKYYFLYKKNKKNTEDLHVFISNIEKSIKSSWKTRVHFISLTQDDFPWYAEHDLYNPYDKTNEHCIVIDPMGDIADYDGINVELQDRVRIVFREYYKRIWNKRVKDPYWRIV